MTACRHVEEISSATILAAKRLAGVTSEVNLWEHVKCLCQMQIRLTNLALKPRGDITISPKQGYQ